MDCSNLWSVTETNKYLYKQLKLLLASAGLPLKQSNNLKATNNHYGELALQRETGKPYYPPEEIQKVWSDVMVSQIESDVVAYFDSFGFSQFAHLSQNWRDGTLSYNAAFGNNDALREFAIAYNSIWMGDYISSLPPLKRAIA